MICRVTIYNKYFNQLIILFKLSPRKVNDKHKNKDKKIYEKADINFLLTNSSTVSNENVEKVVNDPKIPIIKKYLRKSWEKLLFSINTIK